MTNGLIKWCDLWENQTRNRQPYLAGAIGGLKILIFKRHDAKEGEPAWTLFVTERKPRTEQPDPPAVKRPEQPRRWSGSLDPKAVASVGAKVANIETLADDPVFASKGARQRYAEELAAQFAPDAPEDILP